MPRMRKFQDDQAQGRTETLSAKVDSVVTRALEEIRFSGFSDDKTPSDQIRAALDLYLETWFNDHPNWNNPSARAWNCHHEAEYGRRVKEQLEDFWAQYAFFEEHHMVRSLEKQKVEVTQYCVGLRDDLVPPESLLMESANKLLKKIDRSLLEIAGDRFERMWGLDDSPVTNEEMEAGLMDGYPRPDGTPTLSHHPSSAPTNGHRPHLG